MNSLVIGLVHNYLKSSPDTQSLAETFRTKFNPPTLPEDSPSIEDMLDHFQMNAPAKRRLVLHLPSCIPAITAKNAKISHAHKGAFDSEISAGRNKIYKKNQGNWSSSEDKSNSQCELERAQFAGDINALVHNYLKTSPATEGLAETFKKRFNPATLPKSCPSLQEVLEYFQKDPCPPPKRPHPRSLSTSTLLSGVKKPKHSSFDSPGSNSTTAHLKSDGKCRQKINNPEGSAKEDDIQFARLLAALVCQYLKINPATKPLADAFKIVFEPPTLPHGYPTLEEVCNRYQENAAVKGRPIPNFSLPLKTTALKEQGSSFEHRTEDEKKPNSGMKNWGTADFVTSIVQKPTVAHKPDSYNYSHAASTTALPKVKTGRRLTLENTSPAYLVWLCWDNSVSKNNPTTCEFCMKRWKCSGNLKVHLFIHMNKMERKMIESSWDFVCYFCSKRFRCFSILASHFVLHIGERPYKCLVAGCRKTFTRTSSLRVHARSHSKKIAVRRPVKCRLCDQLFTVKSHLKLHIKYHLGIAEHGCEWCDRKFTHRSNLINHVDVKHNDMRHKLHVKSRMKAWGLPSAKLKDG